MPQQRGTRDRLIEAGAELVDEGGAAAVTLREVGARAGVSHNTPYRHFDDKRDLLATVAAAALDDLAERIRAAAARRGTGAERVERAALAYVGWAAARPARFTLVFGPWGDEPHEALGGAADSAVAALHTCVAAAVEDGSLVGDPVRIAAMLWALGHGAADLDRTGHLRKQSTSPTAADLVRELVDRLRRTDHAGALGQG